MTQLSLKKILLVSAFSLCLVPVASNASDTDNVLGTDDLTEKTSTPVLHTPGFGTFSATDYLEMKEIVQQASTQSAPVVEAVSTPLASTKAAESDELISQSFQTSNADNDLAVVNNEETTISTMSTANKTAAQSDVVENLNSTEVKEEDQQPITLTQTVPVVETADNKNEAETKAPATAETITWGTAIWNFITWSKPSNSIKNQNVPAINAVNNTENTSKQSNVDGANQPTTVVVDNTTPTNQTVDTNTVDLSTANSASQ